MTRRIRNAGPSTADKVAARERACERILAMLAEKPRTVAEVMAATGLTDSTACRYLRFMRDMGEVCRAEENGPNNRQIWMLGRDDKGPLVRKPSTAFSGVKVMPARQVGMWRDPLVAAMFGPARGGAA